VYPYPQVALHDAGGATTVSDIDDQAEVDTVAAYERHLFQHRSPGCALACQRLP
jgi:hypothetical protein